MRGRAGPQSAMFSYVSLEGRVPASHPLRKLRMLVDSVLASMDDEFDAIYARAGRPSVPPERLLVESLDYNLLYRWFVGLGIDDDIWDQSTFSQNRDRLFNEGLARIFFERVKALAQWGKLTSSEHFSVDGTLIEAWASHKSFKPKDRSGPPTGPGRNSGGEGGGFKGQRRINDTHASSTDPDTQLFRKSHGAEARLTHMSHVLMENRNGLVVDVDTTPPNGTAAREAALRIIRRQCRRGSTVGADKGYDTRDFVTGCRKAGVTPRTAAKRTGWALDGRTTRRAGYKTSLEVLQRIEEASGWLKTVGSLPKTKLIGCEKPAGQARLCFAAYNLVRIGSLTGWWGAKHV